MAPRSTDSRIWPGHLTAPAPRGVTVLRTENESQGDTNAGSRGAGKKAPSCKYFLTMKEADQPEYESEAVGGGGGRN